MRLRKHIARRSPDAQSQTLMIIDKIIAEDGLLEGGYFDRGVIEDFYWRNCTDWRQLTQRGKPRRPTGERIASPLQALYETDYEPKPIKPKRWADTSPWFRKAMLLYGIKGNQDTHRPITSWIGAELIDQSRHTGRPLAEMVRKRISDRVRRLIGCNDFGIWFHIEPSPENLDRLHLHGLLYIGAARFLIDPSPERSALVKTLRAATGDDGSVPASNWVRITPADMDRNWISYCQKSQRNPRHKTSRQPPPAYIGKRIEAGSYSMIQQAKAFYERSRILTYGIATEKILTWDDDQWNRVCSPDSSVSFYLGA